MTDSTKPNVPRDVLERLTKQLADEGKLIEAGWLIMRIALISKDADKNQLQAMQMAYFAGAQHLFSSIMTIMEEGNEPTAADLDRMELINDELNGFVAEMKAGNKQ